MISLTSEQKLLLQLLTLAVEGKRLQTLPAEADWRALYRETCAQTVTLAVLDVLSDLSIPQEAYKKYFEMGKRVTAGNIRLEHAQMELVSLLEQESHPYVILKGQAAAAYYPTPELRLLGDVDFLVPSDRAETIAESMKALGYQHTCEPGDYHEVLEKPGVYLEMHRTVAGMPEGKAHLSVEQFFSTIYEESVPAEGMFGTFRVPCNAHHAMILILHMQHHTVEWGMGLRHIMDWACFVNRTAREPFWQERLLPLLKQIGLMRFVAVITKMTSVYLGSVCPDWATDAPEDICPQLMEDFLSGGNFGNKDQDRKRASSMLPDWENRQKSSGKLTLLYRSLKQSVMKKHPKLGICPVLRLFLMCGKVIRYLFLFICGKRPNLLKAASHADQRRSIYDRLAMYQPED